MKILSSTLLVFFLITTGSNLESKPLALNIVNHSTESVTVAKSIFNGGRKTKDGRYKRKKGFMWGLFKKKRACDCPKH